MNFTCTVAVLVCLTWLDCLRCFLCAGQHDREGEKTRRHASITAVSRPISPTHTQTSTPTRAVGDAIDAAAAEPGQALRRAPMLMKVEQDARRIPLLGVLQPISPGFFWLRSFSIFSRCTGGCDVCVCVCDVTDLARRPCHDFV